MKHTPGPWKFWPEKLEGKYHVAGRGPSITADKHVIAEVPSGYTKARQDEVAANGRLMAQAPELFDSVKDAISLIENRDAPEWDALAGTWLKYARAAIAKAEG